MNCTIGLKKRLLCALFETAMVALVHMHIYVYTIAEIMTLAQSHHPRTEKLLLRMRCPLRVWNQTVLRHTQMGSPAPRAAQGSRT